MNTTLTEIESNLPKIKELTEKLQKKDIQLQHSNLRYKALVEMLPEIILVHNETTIAFINEYGADLFGYKKNDLIGTDVRDLIHPEDIGHAKLLIKGIAEGSCRQEDFVELRFIKSDGSIMLGEVGSSIIPWGDGDNIQTVIRDITHRKNIENALIKYYYNSGVVNTLPISGKNKYEMADGWDTSLLYRDEKRDIYECNAVKGKELPKHNHVQRETIEVLSGDITIFLGDNGEESINLKDGDEYKIASGIPHRVFANDHSQLKVEFTPPLSSNI